METRGVLSFDQLLLKLRRDGVHLWLDNDQLKYRAPRGTNPDELLSALRDYRNDLRELLRPERLFSPEGTPSLTALGPMPVAPVATMQQGMISAYPLMKNANALHPIVTGVCRRRLHISVLRQCLRELTARHATLRSRFVTSADGQIEAHIAKTVECDIRHLECGEDESAQQEFLANMIRERFDLSRGPLFRIGIVTLAPEVHAVAFVAHHAILDGLSLKILLRELEALYSARLAGQPPPETQAALQFSDFACYQQEWLKCEQADRARKYWEQRLEGSSHPFDLPDTARGEAAPESHGPIRDTVSSEATSRLRDIARSQGTTFRIAALAAFAIMLSRLRGTEEIFTWVCHSGRAHPDLYQSLGCFYDLWLLRMEVPAYATFMDVLQSARDAFVEALPWLELPFTEISRSLGPQSGHIIFSHLLDSESTDIAPGATCGDSNPDVAQAHALIRTLPKAAHFEESARQSFSVSSTESAAGFSWNVQHSPAKIDCDTMERASRSMAAILERVAADPNIRIRDLRLDIDSAALAVR